MTRMDLYGSSLAMDQAETCRDSGQTLKCAKAEPHADSLLLSNSLIIKLQDCIG